MGRGGFIVTGFIFTGGFSVTFSVTGFGSVLACWNLAPVPSLDVLEFGVT
jgi:hypothetical protein